MNFNNKYFQLTKTLILQLSISKARNGLIFECRLHQEILQFQIKYNI